jgi:hypothetical protein
MIAFQVIPQVRMNAQPRPIVLRQFHLAQRGSGGISQVGQQSVEIIPEYAFRQHSQQR